MLSAYPACFFKEESGYSVVFRKDSVDVRDYRTNETVGTFEILSFADTDENVVLDWRECSI